MRWFSETAPPTYKGLAEDHQSAALDAIGGLKYNDGLER
jgi:hypothetical protein